MSSRRKCSRVTLVMISILMVVSVATLVLMIVHTVNGEDKGVAKTRTTTIDPITTLLRRAEAEYKAGDLDAAEGTCDELTQLAPTRGRIAYIRGLICEARPGKCNREAALHWYGVALERGDPMATLQLEVLNGGPGR